MLIGAEAPIADVPSALERTNHYTQGRTTWIYGSSLVTREGPFEDMPLEDLHRCAEAFKESYFANDFTEFIDGHFWSDLMTPLVLGISTVCGIEPLMTWDCMCTQSTDAAREYNKALLSKRAQLEEGCLAAIIPGTRARNKLGNTLLVMFNPIRGRAGSASTKWSLLVVGNAMSNPDARWQQGLEEFLFGSLESDQTTMGCHEIPEIKGIPRVILEAGKSTFNSVDHSMILRILD